MNTDWTINGMLSLALLVMWKQHLSAIKECKKDRAVLRDKQDEHTAKIAKLERQLGAASAPCGLPDCPKNFASNGHKETQ